MRKVYFMAFIVLMLSCSAKDQKLNNIPLEWGKSIDELTGNFVPNGEQIGGCNGYVKVDENFNFEGITAHSVTYGFCNDKLTALQVGMFNKDLNEIVSYLTGKYGKPEVGMNNGLVNYKWNKGLMVAVLLYDKNNGKGIDLTMKNIDPNFEAEALVETTVNPDRNTNVTSTKTPPTSTKTPAPISTTPVKTAAIPATMQVEKPCAVETLYDGFDCELWGTPLDEMQGELVKSKNNTPKLDPYDKVNGKTDYEGIKTATITYCFKNGLFQGVNMALYNKDINKIVKLWTDDFGEPKVVDGAGFFTNYEWHLEGLLLTITYIPKKEDGIGVALGILCENNNFKVRTPAVQSPKTGSSATTVKPVSKPSSTSKTSSSSDSDSRSSARDRLRDKSDTPEAPAERKKTITKEPEVAEEQEEAPAEDSGAKSKRDLMREKRDNR